MPWGNIIAVDRILIARIVFTVMTTGYASATVIADFNKTHATKSKWTPHARFYVVWQICSYVGFGLMALALLWWPGPSALERIYLVVLNGIVICADFFVPVFAMPIYGGGAYDDNSYLPFKALVPLIVDKLDVNITVFSIKLVILAAGLLTVAT